MTPTVSVGPIWVDPTVTAATSATASATRPITAMSPGRPRIRPARPTDRSSARTVRVAIDSALRRGRRAERWRWGRQDEVRVHRQGEVAHAHRETRAGAGDLGV